jgi:23S rRNA pseudouridine2605 synthase
MPPRYAYWTILIDDKPTAFRAREREELQPTFVQLQRKNTNVTMQWFARGRLWASREAERDDFQMRKHAAAAPRDRHADRPEGADRRGSEWRPGGAHKDPRDRFKKKNRPERAWSEKDPATQRDRDKPGFAASSPREPRGSSSDPRTSGGGWSNKPGGSGKRPWTRKPPDKSDVARGFSPEKPREPRRSPSDPRTSGGGWSGKPAGGAPPSDRPWQTKPTGPRAQRKPWSNKPAGDAPRGDRSWSNKPSNAASGGDRPSREKPAGGPPRGDRPWRDKPAGGAPRGDRSWSSKAGAASAKPREPRGSSPDPRTSGGGWSKKPAGGDRPSNSRPAGSAPRGDRPWQDKPRGKPRGDRPWSDKPLAGGGTRPWSGKPREQNRKPFAPRGPQSGGTPVDNSPRKRRDDDPDRD